jgi:hypothetical protein
MQDLRATSSGIAPKTWASSRLLLGRQEMTDDDYWEVAGERFAWGWETAFESDDSWFGGEGGLIVAHEDDAGYVDQSATSVTDRDIETRTIEVYGGWHRTLLREKLIRPYFGFGFALLWAEAEENLVIDDLGGTNPTVRRGDVDRAWALGTYAHAGAFVQINEWLQAGLDLRWLASTEADLREGNAGDLGYSRIALFVGMGR